MRFNVKMNVKLTGVTDKVCEEASKDIQLRFIDNERSPNLDDNQFKNLRESNTGDGYEYMGSWEIFQEKKLPPKMHFTAS